MSDFNVWLELALRWAHVFAGILWVGATFYFTWLDGRFEELAREPEKPGEKKFVWMVHSGGFYAVEKQKVPQLMPATLHWFKWEAAFTWITGFLLFALLFYHGGYLISLEDAPLAKGPAVGLSFGLLLAGWVVYDLLWKFCKHDALGVEDALGACGRPGRVDEIGGVLGAGRRVTGAARIGHQRAHLVLQDHAGTRGNVPARQMRFERHEARAGIGQQEVRLLGSQLAR